MRSKTSAVRLTPRARFARGLKYSTVGPVDVTRGALGLGLTSAYSSATWLGRHYRQSARAAQEGLATELAAAQEVVDIFAANPGVGAIGYKGGMLDRPYLARAQTVLAQAGR